MEGCVDKTLFRSTQSLALFSQLEKRGENNSKESLIGFEKTPLFGSELVDHTKITDTLHTFFFNSIRTFVLWKLFFSDYTTHRDYTGSDVINMANKYWSAVWQIRPAQCRPSFHSHKFVHFHAFLSLFSFFQPYFTSVSMNRREYNCRNYTLKAGLEVLVICVIFIDQTYFISRKKSRNK